MKYFVESNIPIHRVDYGVFRLKVWRNMYREMGDGIYKILHNDININPSCPISVIDKKRSPIDRTFRLELNVFTNNELEKYRKNIICETLELNGLYGNKARKC